MNFFSFFNYLNREGVTQDASYLPDTPKGFAHGFLVLSDVAEFCYKCDDFYHPDDEGGIAWNDPAIGIEWPHILGDYHGTASAMGYSLDGIGLNISEKDQNWANMSEV